MNLVQKAVSEGGKLSPLIIPKDVTNGIGLMNPSLFVDDDGDVIVNIRHSNYTLYHSENTQKFPSKWGPLSYLHPESDMALRTYNFMCLLDENFTVKKYTLVDTKKLDTPPAWEFVGLEDARLVKWKNKYYMAGVRRDVKPNGEGRMELSEVEIDKENWTVKEVKRFRIPAPGSDSSYCEKNWYPVIDKPYHFVKWTAPTEIVKAGITGKNVTCKTEISDNRLFKKDLRGGTQLVKWKDHYICLAHEVNLFFNYLKQKDGVYRHRLCVFDKDLKLIGVSSEEFSFLDGWIEFSAGAAVKDNNLLVTFGFQDNAAFLLKINESTVDNMVKDAIDNELN